MIEGTNPQVGKVTVDEFAAAIKEKYPAYKDIDNLKLANAIIEKYPEYKDAVTFEPVAVEPVKKKDGFTPSTSSVGQSLSQESKQPTEQDFFQNSFGDVLRRFDEIVPLGFGDFIDDMSRSAVQGHYQGIASENASDLLLRGSSSSEEDLYSFLEANKNQQILGPSQEMMDYQKIYEENGKGFMGVVLGLAKNPSILPEIFINSLSAMASDSDAIGAFTATVGTGASVGAGAGAVAGAGVGALPGSVAGAAASVPYAFAAANSAIEMGATFAELLQEEAGEGVELNKDLVKQILNNEESYKRIRNKAITRGIIIGAIDAYTGKLGGKLASKILTKGATQTVKQATKKQVLGSIATATGVEAVGGSTGEAAARAAIGQELDVSEIALEGIAEAPGGIRNLVAKRFSPSKYVVNGEKVTADVMDDLIETMSLSELNDTKISIENDYEGRAQKLEDKKKYLATRQFLKEVSPELSEQQLNEVTELQLELNSLEGNKTEIAKEKISDLKNKIKDVVSTEPTEKTEESSDLYSNLLKPDEKDYTGFSEEESAELSSIDNQIRTLLSEFSATTDPVKKESIRKSIADLRSAKATAMETPVAEETKVAKSEEEIKQEKLEQDVVDIQAKIDNLREEDGSIPEDKSQEFKDLTAAKKNATNRAKRGNSQSTVIIKKQKETGGNFEILDGEEKSFAIAVISKIIASSKTAEEALQKIFSRGYNIDADALGLYLNDKLDSSAPQVGNNKDSFEAWVQGKSDAELSALKGSTEGTPAVEAAVAKEPVVKKVDTEAIGIEENTIADAEFRIEDLQSDIDIEKGNIKEAKDKAKEDIAAARKSKLPKEEKAEKIEEIKAELQDTVDDINGNIGNNKEDISGYKSDIRKANKRIAKLKAVPSVKAKEQLSKETKTEELEIVLLDEQGGRKKLTQTALSDPRNIQKGKMTVEYSDKGLTFKTESDTGRMKENGGELFVSNKEIESIPNINKYKKGTKEYAFQVAEVIGIADQYKGDPIKLMKDSFVKAQDIGKEGTPSAKRFTPAQGAKLAKMVDNFNRIIKRIGVSPVKIVFVNSPAEFKQYYEYTTGSKKETLSKASYLPLQKEIIVDLSKADMTTLAHEMLHAYVSAIKLDRKKITLFTGIIEAELLKGSDAEVKLANELAAFRDEYIKQDVYGKGRTKNDAIIAEEFLAEYVGIMSAYSDNLSPAKQVSFIDKIRAAVVKFLAKIGVVDKSLTAKIQNREDALNFINGFVDALQGRIKVTDKEKVLDQTQPLTDSPIEISSTDIKTSRQQIKTEGTYIKESDLVDVKKLFSDFEKENNREPNVWIWMSDQLKRGDYNNERTGVKTKLEGGVGFAYDKENRAKKIAWASGLSMKTLNERVTKADFIWFMAGSEKSSFNFSKGTTKTIIAEIEAGMSKLKGKTYNGVEIKDGSYEEFTKIALDILKDDKSKKWSAVKSALEKGAKVVDHPIRTKIASDLLNAGTTVKMNLEIHKFLHEDLGVPKLNEFHELIRDEFLKKNEYSNGDMSLIIKPEGVEADANIHDTYPHAILGEVIGMPNKKNYVLDVVPEESKTVISKKTGLPIEKPGTPVMIKTAVGDVGAIYKGKDLSIAKDQIDFAGVDMKAEETPSSKNASIPTGGTAYVPVSKLYNLMDMRDGDRGGLYEKAEDKKRVKNLVDKIRKEGFEYKGSDALYIDIDADGYGWIGEGNHRVLAAIELGMSHLPVRVEFGQARDDKSTYSDGWSRVPTRVISKEKIAELKEKAGPYYHIKYASIWETDLPTNKEPISRDQIDWQPSLFGKGQVNLAIVNRTTPVQEAAVNLLQGKITNSEYQETVRITQPIEAITKFFLPASTKDMKESIDRKKGQLLNAPLKDGQPVGLRLDIPAYKNKNIWVVSVHDKGRSGKSLSYGSVAWATNVQFGSKPKVAAFIAAGKNMDTLEKQDKDTIARMLGEWKNFEGKTKEEKDASAVEKVNEIVKIENSYPGAGRKGSPWRQIGMNPFRHSFFYDRRTGKPVIAAAEVVQIGGLVYAKDVVYADKNDPIFNVEGYKDANGETVRFQLEDQQENENNNKETYSAVEDNQQGLFDAGVDELVDMEVSNTDSWKERPRTMFERFVDLTRLKLQDKFRNIIIVQEDIEFSKGKPVGLDEDFRNAEALMHGKAKEKLNKSEDKIKNIVDKIKSSGLSVERFNELLYAMHAQERNRFLRVASTDVGASLIAMRKKLGIKPSEVAELLGISTQEYNDIEANKKELKTDVLSDILLIYGTTPSRFFYDNAKVKEGSGMTDVEARKILASYDLNLASPDVSQLSTKVRVAVESVRSLMQDTRDILLESGLETPETIKAFQSAYKNYVPLRGFAEGDVDSEIVEGGRKLEVRGREKRARGRETKADSPLTQAIISNTTTIIRAEKNIVMSKFYNLTKNNPNKDIYEIVDPKIKKEYKRDASNLALMTAKTISDYLLDPNMVSIRINGDYKFIRFKDVSKGETSRLAEAIRGSNVTKGGIITKALGSANRFLSKLITTYNPSFVFLNFFRDIQSAVFNLYAEQELSDGLIKGESIVAETITGVPAAIKSIHAVEGGFTGKGKSSKNKEMDQYYREFKEDGATTEWFYSKSITEVQKDIDNLIKGKKESGLKAAQNFIERINSSIENGVRLSSYVSARKAGVSRAKAAELAKNLTVNFNKSGEWGQVANSWFLFFNASAQGVSRLVRTLKPSLVKNSDASRSYNMTTAQKLVAGQVLFGSVLAAINELFSDDDEDEKSFYSKIPNHIKERNIVFMHSLFGIDGGGYFKIPMPYGFNIFHVIGTSVTDGMMGITKPANTISNIMQAVIGSTVPIGVPNSENFENFVLKLVLPTAMSPFVSLSLNENYFGQTIYNKNFPFDRSPKPASELGRKGGYRWTKQITKYLNKASGGSEFRPGSIDFNPDKLDFLMEFITGGAGKFVMRSADVIEKVITGNAEKIEPSKIPFVRTFLGSPSKYTNIQEFYSRTVLVNQMQEEVKNKIILDPEAKRVSKVFYLGKNIRKQLSNLKKREDFVMKIKDPEDQKVRMEKLEKLRYKLVADYNKQYEKFEIDKIK